MKYRNNQDIFEDVTTLLSGSKREMYAFGSWSYPGTDVLRVVITEKNGNKNLDVSMSQARQRVVNCQISEDDSFSGNVLHFI